MKNISHTGAWVAGVYFVTTALIITISLNVFCYWCESLMVAPIFPWLFFNGLGESTFGFFTLIIITGILLYMFGWALELYYKSHK